MTSDLFLLWTIQLAPLAAFLLLFVLPKGARRAAPVVGMVFAFAAAAASITLLFSHAGEHGGFVYEYKTLWLRVTEMALWPGVVMPEYVLSAGFLVDPLNLLMIAIVTTIAFFVQMFSYYYMAEDPSRPRYFAFLSFFSFAMTGLVLACNLLQTFLFWELVGLASYLLIGFWYEKPAAATAARKAFVLNRLADLGFYLGIVFLFFFVGTLDFTAFRPDALREAMGSGWAAAVGLLVFMGVMGKSAQFPFHVWLPDAMEGPTPVSALIHSATMVAAGVFLMARAFGLFAASEAALTAALVAGALTAITGALLATVQRDIKRILAYSTVSQLGLMVMAMGAGSPVAGMFHLSTHAFFKSLLFLTAGAFIHRFHSNDIWEIARAGGKKDKLAMAALTLGLLSLSGIPPLSGFFSKDLLLEALSERSGFFYWIGVAVSFLTAFYSFRLLFVLLFTKPGHAPHAAHAHAPSPFLSACRAVPLVSLALLSLLIGALGTSWGGSALLHWLGGHDAHLDPTIAGTTLVLASIAVVLAFFKFRDPAAAETRLEEEGGSWKRALQHKFYVDDAYEFLVKSVGLSFAAALNWIDKRVFNRLFVDRTSGAVLGLGKLLSRLQSGLLQDYLSLAVGVGIVILLFVLKGTP